MMTRMLGLGSGPQAREWLCKARRHEATLRFCCAHSTVNREQSLFNSAKYSELGTGHSAQNPFWKSKTPLRPLDDGSPLSLGGPSPLLLIALFLLLNIWGSSCHFFHHSPPHPRCHPSLGGEHPHHLCHRIPPHPPRNFPHHFLLVPPLRSSFFVYFMSKFV